MNYLIRYEIRLVTNQARAKSKAAILEPSDSSTPKKMVVYAHSEYLAHRILTFHVLPADKRPISGGSYLRRCRQPAGPGKISVLCPYCGRGMELGPDNTFVLHPGPMKGTDCRHGSPCEGTGKVVAAPAPATDQEKKP
jgi:hypothetical protein